MTIKVGIMGSAGEVADADARRMLSEKAETLAQALAKVKVALLTGATTGIVYLVGKHARDEGVFHIGISPAHNSQEHSQLYKLPIDACDLLIYTGFGLKGRNVVLVRSCDIVLFIAGAMGSLNEFTIAHDEGKIIGCLTNSGGVADEAQYLLQKFSKGGAARVFQNEDPAKLLDTCLSAYATRDN